MRNSIEVLEDSLGTLKWAKKLQTQRKKALIKLWKKEFTDNYLSELDATIAEHINAIKILKKHEKSNKVIKSGI